jgi:hypothetical protein
MRPRSRRSKPAAGPGWPRAAPRNWSGTNPPPRATAAAYGSSPTSARVAEAAEAVACGAEGVGVLRTEFLFLGRAAAPGEEEQLAAYRAIAESLGGVR